MPTPVRYRSDEEDSGRWLAFPFRPGDIVISTRSKSGTTWMQMICALLVFQTADLPAPLARLSPWLDWLTTAQDQMYAQLAAQEHRRFIKTHTPLDGVPVDPAAFYIVVARHPLDMAVSLYHQGNNINRERLSELTGAPPPTTGPAPPPATAAASPGTTITAPPPVTGTAATPTTTAADHPPRPPRRRPPLRPRRPPRRRPPLRPRRRPPLRPRRPPRRRPPLRPRRPPRRLSARRRLGQRCDHGWCAGSSGRVIRARRWIRCPECSGI